jgi:hypothetical protein
MLHKLFKVEKGEPLSKKLAKAIEAKLFLDLRGLKAIHTLHNPDDYVKEDVDFALAHIRDNYCPTLSVDNLQKVVSKEIDENGKLTVENYDLLKKQLITSQKKPSNEKLESELKKAGEAKFASHRHSLNQYTKLPKDKKSDTASGEREKNIWYMKYLLEGENRYNFVRECVLQEFNRLLVDPNPKGKPLQPKTRLVTLEDGGTGLISKQVEFNPLADITNFSELVLRGQIERLNESAMVSYIIDDTDRHNHNQGLNSTNEIVSLDRGKTLSTTSPSTPDYKVIKSLPYLAISSSYKPSNWYGLISYSLSTKGVKRNEQNSFITQAMSRNKKLTLEKYQTLLKAIVLPPELINAFVGSYTTDETEYNILRDALYQRLLEFRKQALRIPGFRDYLCDVASLDYLKAYLADLAAFKTTGKNILVNRLGGADKVAELILDVRNALIEKVQDASALDDKPTVAPTPTSVLKEKDMPILTDKGTDKDVKPLEISKDKDPSPVVSKAVPTAIEEKEDKNATYYVLGMLKNYDINNPASIQEMLKSINFNRKFKANGKSSIIGNYMQNNEYPNLQAAENALHIIAYNKGFVVPGIIIKVKRSSKLELDTSDILGTEMYGKLLQDFAIAPAQSDTVVSAPKLVQQPTFFQTLAKKNFDFKPFYKELKDIPNSDALINLLRKHDGKIPSHEAFIDINKAIISLKSKSKVTYKGFLMKLFADLQGYDYEEPKINTSKTPAYNPFGKK